MTRPLDEMIGRLDRLLSEFLIAAESPLDEADQQTIKHHADDLIGVGNAALKKLAKRVEGKPRAVPCCQPTHVAGYFHPLYRACGRKMGHEGECAGTGPQYVETLRGQFAYQYPDSAERWHRAWREPSEYVGNRTPQQIALDNQLAKKLNPIW